jgi:hypothetical protein
MSAHDWRDQAACIGAPDTAFFPTNTLTSQADTKRTINTWCRPCPVREQCLADAMRTEGLGGGKRHGIRGGLSGRGRTRLAATMKKEGAA